MPQTIQASVETDNVQIPAREFKRGFPNMHPFFITFTTPPIPKCSSRSHPATIVLTQKRPFDRYVLLDVMPPGMGMHLNSNLEIRWLGLLCLGGAAIEFERAAVATLPQQWSSFYTALHLHCSLSAILGPAALCLTLEGIPMEGGIFGPSPSSSFFNTLFTIFQLCFTECILVQGTVAL